MEVQWNVEKISGIFNFREWRKLSVTRTHAMVKQMTPVKRPLMTDC
jgi:hypothetical protein